MKNLKLKIKNGMTCLCVIAVLMGAYRTTGANVPAAPMAGVFPMPEDITKELAPDMPVVGQHPIGDWLLTWPQTTDPNVQGIMVHYGTAANALYCSLDVGLVTNCTISNLDLERTWYADLTGYWTNCCPDVSTNSRGVVTTNGLLVEGPPSAIISLITSNLVAYCGCVGADGFYAQWGTNGVLYNIFDGPTPDTATNLVYSYVGTGAPFGFVESVQTQHFFKPQAVLSSQ
jgi:hypothetical protein